MLAARTCQDLPQTSAWGPASGPGPWPPTAEALYPHSLVAKVRCPDRFATWLCGRSRTLGTDAHDPGLIGGPPREAVPP